MRAIIVPDPQRGAEHACILLEGCSAVNSPAFTLCRSSDMKFLAPGGWQESESPLQPDACDSVNGSVRLHIGPAVVSQLDKLVSYRLTVDGKAAILDVSQLAYSRQQGYGGAMPDSPSVQPVSAPAPQSPPAPQPEPETQPEPEPAPTPEDAPAFMPEPQHPGPDELFLQESAPKRKSRVLPLVLLLLLLAIGGAAAWYFLVYSQPASPVPPVPQADSAPADAGAGKPAPSALDMARQHLRGGADPAGSLSLGKPLRTPEATPEEADAAFLLLEDAAQKNQAEAMWLVGQYYDPTCSLPRGSIPTDMALARQWYEKAKAAGISQADQALKSLRAHVEAEAAKGNMEAKLLLQNWK